MDKLLKLLFCCLLSTIGCSAQKIYYEAANLKLTERFVLDSLRTIDMQMLPSVEPANMTELSKGTPIMHKLWKVALSDIESNIVQTNNGRYFGAGKNFGLRIYTRDISFSGILGLNVLYPEEMLSSLKTSRDVRLKLGLRVAKDYLVPGIGGDWMEESFDEKTYLNKYNTNSYTRRTDDVVWLWATRDLFEKNENLAEWQWLYEVGKKCFDKLYSPFYDESDGLYRGQASFIDIHFEQSKATGYPQDFSIADCVSIKALSTNCLYYEGLQTMAMACRKTGRKTEGIEWEMRAKHLKNAILSNLRFKDGTFSYFKYMNGELESRRDALGSALAVITGIVKGKDAKVCLSDYPVTWAGVPLFHPFYPWAKSYHNNTSWPFVDTFFLWAKELAGHKSYASQNAALLARTCVKGGSFHEVVNWKTKEPGGSGRQLWSASAFVNVCLRAGLVDAE
ncbi:glucosidase family protein [Bacteroides sp.]|uniref:hypothetical protein n=1 Tax=Bacteroides sp. TaxID=29523 RepID=UPI0025C3EE28|nr:hypothetical protein [Bacteroides sp.]